MVMKQLPKKKRCQSRFFFYYCLIIVDIKSKVGYSRDSIKIKGAIMIYEILLAIVVAGIIFACLLLLYIHYENKQFRLTHYTYSSEKLPKAFDGSKLLFLSDLHGYEYGERNSKLIEAIDKEHPDFILIGGDMFVKGPNFDGRVALELIKELSKKYPIYYANGNHELRVSLLPETKKSTYVEYIDALSSYGVKYLVNDGVSIEKAGEVIRIVGLNLPELYYSKFKKVNLSNNILKEQIGVADEKTFTILLAHNPSYFEEYSRWGADMVLSGHVHGGMIALPFVGGVISTQGWLFPKYDFGEFHLGASIMYLSRGLGNHTINVRINNRAEAVVIHLKNR